MPKVGSKDSKMKQAKQPVSYGNDDDAEDDDDYNDDVHDASLAFEGGEDNYDDDDGGAGAGGNGGPRKSKSKGAIRSVGRSIGTAAAAAAASAAVSASQAQAACAAAAATSAAAATAAASAAAAAARSPTSVILGRAPARQANKELQDPAGRSAAATETQPRPAAADMVPRGSAAEAKQHLSPIGARVWSEAGTLSLLAYPQTISGLTNFVPRLLALVAVGHLENGAVLIGAAGIGGMYSNFAHLMMIKATAYGATPLFSQAFGAGNHRRLGLVLMRVLLLHALMSVCLSLPLTYLAGPLLATAGLPEAVAAHVQTFVWIRLVGAPGMFVANDVQAFLNAQRCVRLPMLVNLVGSLFQAVLLFPLTAAIGFVGAPWAMTMVELLQGGLLCAASPWLLGRQRLRSWPAWWRERREACRGWAEIVNKGAPAAVMVVSEWFGWECTLFVASGLCPRTTDSCPAVDAIPICTTVFVCQFIIAFGVCLAMGNRVGNLLGEGRPADARFCARTAWGMAAGVQLVSATLILSFRRPIASFFVEDGEVLAHVSELMPITTAYSMLATMASGLSHQLQFGLGANLQVPAAINFTCFFGIGVPLGAVLAYQAGLGVRGLWAGLILAMLLIIIGQYVHLYRTVDWQAASQRARERAAKDATGADENEGRGLAAADAALPTGLPADWRSTKEKAVEPLDDVL
jgi:multidrug resistance protein, MATE family